MKNLYSLRNAIRIIALGLLLLISAKQDVFAYGITSIGGSGWSGTLNYASNSTIYVCYGSSCIIYTDVTASETVSGTIYYRKWQTSSDGVSWFTTSYSGSGSPSTNSTTSTYYRCVQRSTGGVTLAGSETPWVRMILGPSFVSSVSGLTVSTTNYTGTQFTANWTTSSTAHGPSTMDIRHYMFCSTTSTFTSGTQAPGFNSSCAKLITACSDATSGIAGCTNPNTAVSYTVTGLTPGVTYYWKVIAQSWHEESSNGDLYCGYQSSYTATQTVSSCVEPIVTTQPATQTICVGNPVTFSTVSSGTAPLSYQWQYNGSNISGATSDSYSIPSTAALDAGNYTCIVTNACGDDTTALASLTVNNYQAVGVSIAANPGTAVCTGQSVTFTATPTNGGSNPSYQWQINGANAGTNSSTYTTSSLSNGDVITCIMTSNYSCPTGNPATSNSLNITITSGIPASVSISANPGTSICTGQSVTYTATAVNGGASPTYQWQLNGSNVGTNSSTYTNPSINNGDVVTCIMTSNATCATGSPATSNSLSMTVNSSLPASVTISANPGTSICIGQTVTYTAIAVNGGAAPTYQWQLNGSNTGTNSSIYTTAGLVNGDVVTCIMTSNSSCATGSPATSNTLTMTVSSSLTASVTISANPGTTTCSGTNVSFTASPANGGTTPSYQWQLNGSNVGTNSSTYSNSSLVNGDIITCIMTSNASCATGSPATSNALTMTVSPSVTASVAISANPGTAICSGTNVILTATATNGGTTPTYQWQLNGGNVGTNSSTYASSVLVNGDIVTCIMTSNASCATGSPATSNALTMTVSPSATASMAISANPGTTICSGTNVIFSATATNGGTTPAYQWQLNGSNVGANSSTYSNGSLINGDIVTCLMTSNASCTTGSPATSNSLVMTVSSSLTASVTISANPGTTICSGTSVTFTATPTNGGVTPSYQWQLNGSNVGTNNSTYANSALANGDIVTCIMTSNSACATGSPATSNALAITISAFLPVSVSISANPGINICSGTNVTFTAVATNGGTIPTYQWQVNGISIGSNSSTYSSSGLVNGDIVTCNLTSNFSCATGNPATSNALTIAVSASQPVAVSISASPTNTACQGTTVTFTATSTNGGSGPAYLWTLNGSNVGTNSSVYTTNTLNSGDIIYCIVTSSATCVTGNPANSNTITMTMIAAPTANAGSDQIICTGNSAILNASGGVTYAWNNGASTQSTTVNPSVTSTYIVTVTANGCTASDNVTVTVMPVVNAAASIDQTICQGDSTAILAAGGTIYSWSNGMTGSTVYVNPVATTTYIVTVSNGGCSDTDDVTVTVNPAPSAEAGSDQVICTGNNVVLFTSGGDHYLWSNGDTTASITVSPLSTTLYTLTVSIGSCYATDNVVVAVNPSPDAAFTAIDTTVGVNENVIFSDQSIGADSWEWHFGDGTTSAEQNPVHTYADNGYYTIILIVTNAEGCSDSLIMIDYVHVFGDADFFIPSCFTPNNDGENDILYVRGTNIDNLDFKVYDQWGIIVFETTDITKGWDGTYNGTPLPIGNFVYRVKILAPGGEPVSKEGIVSIVR